MTGHAASESASDPESAFDPEPEPASTRSPRATGTLAARGARPAVRLERELPDPPAAVWRALTDPQELRSWFPTEIRTERWEVGATLSFVFPDHPEYDMTGTVLELDEPRVLAYSWGEEKLRFELTPTAAGGTLLVFYDELAPGIAARNAAGWQVCLERLAGQVPPDYAWRPLFAQYSAAFEPELGPQEGPPKGFEDHP
jgi:uncharacterized protein YndB with AHSA1/START domain